MTDFRIRVNDGPEQPLTVATSFYRDAAAAVPAILGIDTPIKVEIWDAPTKDRCCLTFAVHEDEFGRLVAGSWKRADRLGGLE